MIVYRVKEKGKEKEKKEKAIVRSAPDGSDKHSFLKIFQYYDPSRVTPCQNVQKCVAYSQKKRPHARTKRRIIKMMRYNSRPDEHSAKKQ